MKNIYSLRSNFHIRYCNLSYEKFKSDISILNSKEIMDYLNKNWALYELALYYASPSLYKKLLNSRELSQNELNILGITMYKYLSRMAFRPTPFGNFSSFQLGIFSEENKIQIQDKIDVSIEISEMWFRDIRLQIEENIFYYDQLCIKVSPMIWIRSGYILLFDGVSDSKNEKKIKIKITEVLQFVIDLSYNSININILCEKIKDKYKIDDINKCREYIKSLIKMNIVITDLYEETNHINKLDRLIEEFKLQEKELLIKIRDDLKFLKKNPKEVEIIQRMIGNQKSIVESNQYIYLNSYNKNKAILHNREKKVIERYANIISFFTRNINSSLFLQKYIDYFEQLNDGNKAIPLLKLINETTNKQWDEVIEHSESNGTIYDWLAESISQSIYLKQDLELAEKDIERLYVEYTNNDNSKYIEEFDILFSVHLKEKQFYYFFIPQTINTPSGSYLGRVGHIYPDENRIDTLYKHDYSKNNFQEVKLMDKSYSLNASDLVEKNYYEGITKIDFTLQTNNGIKVNEIFVVKKGNYLIPYINKNNQALIVKQFNMINSLAVYNRMYQFLYVTRLQFQHHMTDFFNDLIHQFYYVPRISYKSLIILKRHWKITYEHLTYFDKYIGTDTLYIFFEKIKLPKWIGVTTGPDTNYYNIDNKMHLKIILSSLKKKGYLILTEWERDILLEESDSIIPFKNNQFVFSLTNKAYNLPLRFEHTEYEISKIYDETWESIKIYFPEILQNAYISYDLKKIAKYLEQLGIEKYFFIRYMDPSPHIRVRIKNNININLTKLKKYIYQLSIEPEDVVISSFQPEYHRYGGKSLTNKILDFFCMETSNVLTLNEKQNILDSKEFIVAYMYEYLINFGISKKTIFRVLIPFKNYKINRRDIQKSLEKISILSSKLKDSKILENKLLNFRIEEILQNNNYIILSLLHMTINRFALYDPINEKKIMRLLYEQARILNFK